MRPLGPPSACRLEPPPVRTAPPAPGLALARGVQVAHGRVRPGGHGERFRPAKQRRLANRPRFLVCPADMVTSSCTNRCACDIRSSDSSSRALLDDIAHFFQARRSLKRLVERYGRWRKCRGRASSRSVGAQASRCVRHLRRPEANSTSSNRNLLEQVRSSLSDRVDLARDSESEIAGAGGGPTASAVSPCCSRGARSVGRGSATPLRSSPVPVSIRSWGSGGPTHRPASLDDDPVAKANDVLPPCDETRLCTYIPPISREHLIDTVVNITLPTAQVRTAPGLRAWRAWARRWRPTCAPIVLSSMGPSG